jgi:hypothetical protein
VCDTHYNEGREARAIAAGALCAEDGCERGAVTGGRCTTHYKKEWDGRDRPECSELGCERQRIGNAARCALHRDRFRRSGDAGPAGLLIAPKGSGHVNSNGYRLIFREGRYILEHRWVMEQLLGRQLLPTEEVHHCNRIKTDNRVNGPLADFRSGNLELWSHSQPTGARVSDLIAYHVEQLALYAPELLAANPVQLKLIA